MDELTFQSLDLESILDTIKALCPSELGQRAIDDLPVLDNPTDLLRARVLVELTLRAFQQLRPPPFRRFPDPSTQVDHVLLEKNLEGRHLRLLAEYCHFMDQVQTWLAEADLPALTDFLLDWPAFGEWALEVLSRLQPDGQPDPKKNPSLIRLTAQLNALRERRQQEIKRIFLTTNPEFWQDTNFVDRGGRLLLPLKTDFKGRVGGVVHTVSQSGQTLFLEPYELVSLNNDCIEAEEGYRWECQKILKELAEKLRHRKSEFELFLKKAATWETIYARAAWGVEHHADFPGLTDPFSKWEMLEARHPLLGQKAVPVSLVLPSGSRGLVISGPNTGGKTVLLKTLATLTWLNQRACPVPVSPSSIFPVFTDWMADLGDHQSLESALSTYSAHLERQKTILNQVRPKTLVILDELGSGTDPREGGALAIALLEELEEREIFVALSTHHHQIKNYPRQAKGYFNISMEFDLTLGRPTFRVLSGATGRSHALETASLLGLPKTLIERARRILEEDSTALEKRLAKLDEEEQRIQLKNEELTRLENTLKRELQEQEQKRIQLEQQRRRWEQERLLEKSQELAQMRREFERLVRDFHQANQDKSSTQEVRRWLQQESRGVQENLEGFKDNEETSQAPTLTAGDEVWYNDKRAILEKEIRPGIWRVQVGALRLELSASQLIKIEPQKEDAGRRAASSLVSEKKAVFSLDLRGFRVEEALKRLDEQIDRALLEGLSEFQVIHGLGEGILMKAVKDFLSKNPYVKDFSYARPEEGGFGKTIVHL